MIKEKTLFTSLLLLLLLLFSLVFEQFGWRLDTPLLSYEGYHIFLLLIVAEEKGFT